MQPADAKRKIEELMGRRDAVRGECKRAQELVKKFASLNQIVEAREAEADCVRLQQRLALIDRELEKLRRYW